MQPQSQEIPVSPPRHLLFTAETRSPSNPARV